LGQATIFVPAAERGRLWLIDYPGGRIGAGTPTLREVDTTGHVWVTAQGLDPSHYPEIGIPGGIAYQTGQGIALWDAVSGRVTARLGHGTGYVSDISDHRLAWCDQTCSTFHVTDLASGRDVAAPAPAATGTFAASSARFSPDGGVLAVIAGGGDPSDRTSKVAVALIHTQSGLVETVNLRIAQRPWSLAWSPDGTRLFYSSYSYTQSSTTLGDYQLAVHTLHTATLHFGGVISVDVVLDIRTVGALLASSLGTQEA
jgi:WD40 repeat protein